MEKKEFSFVFTKNMKTGELVSCESFDSFEEAMDYNNAGVFKETLENKDDCNSEVLTTSAFTKEEAIATISTIYPEFASDSQELIKEYIECCKDGE